MISPGTTVGGQYRLDERVAAGGMGDVWRGVDTVLGRPVAVKLMLASLLDEPGFAARFLVNARVMSNLKHPGVVEIYDYGVEPEAGAYLVMEYVEGDSLWHILTRVGRLTPARTMALVADAAESLHALHDAGWVHRDVGPGSLLVRPDATLILTDFGIRRTTGAAMFAGGAGAVLYMSPEQAMGEQATPLSDVYSLGVVAYLCLAGRRPFEGDNVLEIAMRHVREAPPPLPADIPPAVQAIVLRALAKDPAARWRTAAELAVVARRAAAELAADLATTDAGEDGMLPTPVGEHNTAIPDQLDSD